MTTFNPFEDPLTIIDDYNYESLPSFYSVKAHMLSGAAAGITEHTFMYHIDTVKTRMQSLVRHPTNSYRKVPFLAPVESLIKIIKCEGYKRPFKGIGVMVIGAGPAHALYFSVYEKMKRVLSGTETGANNPLAQGAAGCLSTVVHDAVMNPAEVIKQRMQMFNSPYKNIRQCFGGIWKNEGIRAFYRSYTTQLAMNMPFQFFHFMTYEFMQELFNKERIYSPFAHMFSGAVAGAFASAVTNPFDVCKTLLNTQETQVLNNIHQDRVKGIVAGFATIYRCCGIRGYFNGLQARVLYAIPSTAISWSVYEAIKYYINNRDHKIRTIQRISKIESFYDSKDT